MAILTKLLLATVLVSGTASSVLASNSQFDVDIYRPKIQHNGLDAYAREPAVGPAQVPAPQVRPCIPQYDSSGVQRAPYCHR
jgi:hypothetical protein